MGMDCESFANISFFPSDSQPDPLLTLLPNMNFLACSVSAVPNIGSSNHEVMSGADTGKIEGLPGRRKFVL